MNYNLLTDQIIKIQDAYKDLLISLQENIKYEFSMAILDEIVLFWKRNIGIVQLYLYNDFYNNDGYVFTAATFMDYEDDEQYPFLLLGKKHILDDPLCKYSSICCFTKNHNIPEIFKEQIKLTLDDNIKILENCEKSILLLPLRLLSQTDKTDTIITLGEKVFISLFDNIETIENYFEKCNTLSDIMSYAKTDMEKWVVFSEYDDKSLSFEKRFERTLEYNADIIGHCKSDAEAFYVIIYGHIQQAVDVIASCLEYNCIPFVRYPVALNYILLLIESLNEQYYLKNMRFKICIANLIYRMCDKEKLSLIRFENFIKIINKYNFSDKLFDTLKENNINENDFTIKNIVNIIDNSLNKLYVLLKNEAKN